MKPITLTEEHKSKLLEMCRVLFPEMFTPTIQDNGYINYSDIGINIKYEDKFHWFEFCMTHLFYKIYDLWRHEEVNCITIFHLNVHNYYFNIEDKNEKYHPINYLYKQFKLLK